jgi:hypothetical protein
MKRLIVLSAFALLFMWAGHADGACYVRFHRYAPRPLIVCGVYHRAWIPIYRRWNAGYHRYFWVPAFRY